MNIESFKYVNTAHEYAPKKMSRHQVLEADTAPSEMMKAYGTTGLYTSPLKFQDKQAAFDSPEYGDFYLDFDSADPTLSRLECLKALNWLLNDLGIENDDIHIFFSGSKGYHILVNAQALDIHPQPFLRSVYKSLAAYLKSSLQLSTLDMSVYSFQRLLRVPRSRHSITGLYKIYLPYKTLFMKSHEAIKELAKAEGDIEPAFSNTTVLNEKIKEFLEQKQKVVVQTSTTHTVFEPTIPEELTLKLKGLPTCITDMLERFMVAGSVRFAAQMKIATYFKALGVPQDEVLEILMERIKYAYPENRHQEIYRQVKDCIKQIYTNERYHFNCAFMLGLTSGLSDPQAKVKCSGSDCPLFEQFGTPTKAVKINDEKESLEVA